MNPRRFVGLMSLIVGLGGASVPAYGGDSAAEATLKEKGLFRAGRAFVIEAEKPVLARMKDVKAAYTAYSQLLEKQLASERHEAESAQLEQTRVDLKTHLDDLNQRIIEQAASGAGGGGGGRGGPGGGGGAGGANATSPLILQRDQIKNTLAEVTVGQKALKAEAPVVRDKAALDESVKQKAQAFKAALAEIRPMVDEVSKKYADLAADASVKKALADLSRATKANARLGPSDAFAAMVKELDQAERRFLGKKPATLVKKKSKAKK